MARGDQEHEVRTARNDRLHQVPSGVEQVLGSIHDEQLVSGPERHDDVGDARVGVPGDSQRGGERRDQVVGPRDTRDR